ncbi:NAD(P)-dependent alcohol dehydrogenase [Burkholderia anthina]|uniref:NAD(P)-dependent alcohol dehydrogenase n=1 Tax=Burkholderia anthina TaxID=179879 RepID=UPI001CF43D38|nr:NAD(P)-dependent alcohol dehydrogenase [Burkholderia anthina]MCA8094845.1 NAD(P)-dependent alcohol dehydrogenase [Burkholderia anthina]
MEIQAAVARVTRGDFTVETVSLADIEVDEVLVRLVATGICHTDLSAVDGILPLPLPLVAGHEGAGIIERVGRNVKGLEPGDSVVLTFASCGRCANCSDHHPAYCDHYGALNFGMHRADGTPTLVDAKGRYLGGAFFAQSSFATYAIATPSNIVKVRRDAPLALLGPLGCGLTTGAGTVLNVLKPAPEATFAVIGTGALGMAAIMAAKILGVRRIVAVDRVQSRLELARELGASETIDTTSQNVADAFPALGGLDAVIDTSGVPKLIEAAVGALRTRGTCVILGAGAEQDLKLNVMQMIGGKSIRGVVNGDCEPDKLIPRLVDLHMEERFPIERLVEYYPLSDINRAVADSRSGRVIKPIIKFD